jgi:formylglycine-generating enzyme required for sulfatase activity
MDRWEDGKPLGTEKVGSKKPNAFGLYDMAGNVWEWTGTWSSKHTESGTNPRGVKNGKSRLLRGGSWANIGASVLRSASRITIGPTSGVDAVGFRVVRSE